MIGKLGVKSHSLTVSISDDVLIVVWVSLKHWHRPHLTGFEFCVCKFNFGRNGRLESVVESCLLKTHRISTAGTACHLTFFQKRRSRLTAVARELVWNYRNYSLWLGFIIRKILGEHLGSGNIARLALNRDTITLDCDILHNVHIRVKDCFGLLCKQPLVFKGGIWIKLFKRNCTGGVSASCTFLIWIELTEVCQNFLIRYGSSQWLLRCFLTDVLFVIGLDLDLATTLEPVAAF